MQTGLAGIRVLEVAGGVGVAYAAKLFADLGADVVRLEPPADRLAEDIVRERPHRVDAWLNTNKRSIVDVPSEQSEHREQGEQGEQSEHRDQSETSKHSELFETAHILLHDLGPKRAIEAGLSFDQLSAKNPSLVVCSITPFGSTGPYANFVGEELNVIHGSSWGFLSPSASTRIDLPPLKAPGHHATINAATTAATVALAAFDQAEQTGFGTYVDFSLFGAAAKMTETAPISASYHGVNASRLGVKIVIPWNIYRCRDGLVQFICPEEPQWQAFVTLMGNPDWTQLEAFSTAIARRENADLVDLYLSEWIAEQTVDELYRSAQAARICITPMHTMAQLDVDPHFAERGFFSSTPDDLRLPGPGAQNDLGWWGLRRSAPTRGQHNGETWLPLSQPTSRSTPRDQLGSIKPSPGSAVGDPQVREAIDPKPVDSKPEQMSRDATPGERRQPMVSRRPLEGIRVCDFSWIWAGPYCTQTLAHLGADVIKLESLDRLCMFRRLPYSPTGVPLTHDTAGVFHLYNTDKRSVGIDLRKPESRAIIEKLVAVSDVVVDNFGVGTMVRLGLGPEELRKINPNVIVVSLSGYGQTGPAASYMAYGPAGGAFAGLYAANGYPGGFPAETGIAIGDPGTGIAGAWAVMAALAARRRNGEVATIDGAMVEAVAATIGEPWMEWQSTGKLPGPRGNHDPIWSPHNCYPALGADNWVTIACTTETNWLNLCALIDPTLGTDSRFATAENRKANETELDQRIAAWTAQQDRWDISHWLQNVGVAAFPSLSPVDLWGGVAQSEEHTSGDSRGGDPHLEAIGMLARPNHGAVGTRIIPGIPWLLSNAKNAENADNAEAEGVPANGVRLPAPLLGEHSTEVLTTVLGYTSEDVGKFVGSGVITEP